MSRSSAWSAVPMLHDFAAAPEAVKCAARIFRVLEFFDEIRRPARANEICGSLGFPQSTMSVLLNSLVKLGYLDFDVATKAYLPSLRTAVLSTWRDTGYFRDGSMLGLLEDLATRLGLAACLTTRAGIFVRYLNVVQHRQPGDVHITLNARRYAVRSAAGIVLLKDVPESEVRALVHGTKAQGEPSVETVNLADVRAAIAQARTDGHFFSRGLVSPESGAIAVSLPLQVTGGWQHMALSMAGRLDQVEANADAIIAEVKRATAQLVRA